MSRESSRFPHPLLLLRQALFMIMVMTMTMTMMMTMVMTMVMTMMMTMYVDRGMQEHMISAESKQ